MSEVACAAVRWGERRVKIDASTAIRVRAVFSLAVTTAFLASFLARPAGAAEVWEKTLAETSTPTR